MSLRAPPAACVALVLLACATRGGIAARAPEPGVHIDHYAVEGRTLDEIRRDVLAKGPRDALGRRRAARTDWSLAWRYACRPGPSACHVTRLETSSSITITLPSLRSAVPRHVHTQWQAFHDALADHEDGHRRITLACRDELAQRLARVGPARDCADLQQRVDAAGHAVDAACRARHAAFDEQTEHGVKVGSLF